MTEDKKGEWQPIETAPRDGTTVDVWWSAWRVPNAWWSKANGKWAFEETDGRFMPPRRNIAYLGSDPTHWMPLPTPPVESRP